MTQVMITAAVVLLIMIVVGLLELCRKVTEWVDVICDYLSDVMVALDKATKDVAQSSKDISEANRTIQRIDLKESLNRDTIEEMRAKVRRIERSVSQSNGRKAE